MLYKRTVNIKKFSKPSCCVSGWELLGEHLIIHEKFYDGYPLKQRYTESDVQDLLVAVVTAHLFNNYVMDGESHPFLKGDPAYD